MSKETVSNIIRAIGARRMCELLGVTPHAVRYAKSAGSFPAGWYDALDVACLEIGIACPRKIFNWRTVAKKSSNFSQVLQGDGKEKAITVGGDAAGYAA